MATAAKVDALYMVETPEGVDFQFRLAGPGRRGAAFFLDWVIKLSVFFLAFIALTFFAILPESLTNAATGLALLLFFFLNWLYSVLFEWLMRGQTPGKRALNLRVVRSNGTPIDFLTAAGRGLLLGADALPGTFLAGVASMLHTPRMQRTGDLVFDTIVIYEIREDVALTLRAMAPVEPILKSDCNGRFQIPERTLALIESLFDSTRYITGNRREELARILALPIAKRLGFTLPAESGNYYVDPYNQEYFGDYSLFLRRVMETFGSRAPSTGGGIQFQQQPGIQPASAYPSVAGTPDFGTAPGAFAPGQPGNYPPRQNPDQFFRPGAIDSPAYSPLPTSRTNQPHGAQAGYHPGYPPPAPSVNPNAPKMPPARDPNPFARQSPPPEIGSDGIPIARPIDENDLNQSDNENEGRKPEGDNEA
ncbi:MAG: RDD family protein [Planctomycetota bacterium]